MAEIHKSQKFKQFQVVAATKASAVHEWSRIRDNWSAKEPGEDGYIFWLEANGGLALTSTKHSGVGISAEGAYVLYQLLDRAFGKD